MKTTNAKDINSGSRKKRYYRKHVGLLELIDKIKLWPSRMGVLHGIKSVKNKGSKAEVTTHCGEHFIVYNSKKSRAARWLRNKWAVKPCTKCKVPKWKLEKFDSTYFSEQYGSNLSCKK